MKFSFAAHRWHLAAVVLVTGLLYAQTVSFDFVNYDDYDLVARNTEFLSDPLNALQPFTTHAFAQHRQEGVYYRPVLILSYFFDYLLWGANPAGFHLTNVLLHCAVAAALLILLLEVTGSALPATAGALLFGLHPVQTESVAWIAGRNDVLLGVFVTLFILCYILHYAIPARKTLMLGCSAAAFLLALLTKESAMFFLALIPLYEVTVRRMTIREALTPLSVPGVQERIYAATLLSIAAGYLFVRFSIFGALIGAEQLYGKITLWNRLFMAPGLAFESILLMLWPASLSVVRPIEDVIWFDFPWWTLAYLACGGLAAAVAYLVRSKRQPALAFGLGWIIIGLVPLLNIAPLAVPILEHRLYVVLGGLAVALAAVAASKARSVVVWAGGAICLLCALLSVVRMPVWRNSETLWLDAIAKRPAGARAYFNLAGYYFERAEYPKTAELLTRYIALRPDDFLGYAKLRQTYFNMGNVAGAGRVCRKLIDLNPDNENRYLEAGVLYERFGPADSLVSIYEEGLRANPEFYRLHYRLGAHYRRIRNDGKASHHFASVVRILESSGRPLTPEEQNLLASLRGGTQGGP